MPAGTLPIFSLEQGGVVEAPGTPPSKEQPEATLPAPVAGQPQLEQQPAEGGPDAAPA